MTIFEQGLHEFLIEFIGRNDAHRPLPLPKITASSPEGSP